jgi:hypothetical protein
MQTPGLATMIRFANPGSDISGFTRIFQVLVDVLEERQPFSLDDISAALVERGLATSSGFMGPEALVRSTREDRSRDPLYNQSKMYSELFRLLGWIHPSADSRLTFTFTWLGLHVREARGNAKALVRESVLGIAFPNEGVDAQGEYVLRPFATILRTMAQLADVMCRDEMILGPLCLDDDTDPAKFDAMVRRIRSVRGHAARLETALDKIAASRRVQRNTMENYTRFPLAVLEWSGWTTKGNDSSLYGERVVLHRLTNEGRAQEALLNSAVDLRAGRVSGLDAPVKEAVCRLAAIRMLERAGFDTEVLRADMERWARVAARVGVIPLPTSEVVFSPFHEMSPSYVDSLYGAGGQGAARVLTTTPPAGGRQGRSGSAAIPVRLKGKGATLHAQGTEGYNVAKLIKTVASEVGGKPEWVVEELMRRYENANKGEFYPLVAGLFSCLGYDCTASRAGVNYQRWDAAIRHATESVPIEIKSPGEERWISVKAVRQAIENKVIVLARKPFKTQKETSTFVVGYLPPNDRAEVGGLVADVSTAFGINVGVVDFRSLATIAVAAVLEGRAHDSQALLNLRGFIDVVDA